MPAKRGPGVDGCGLEGLCHTGTGKRQGQQGSLEVLAKWLGVRKSQIELISGETASQKKFLVARMSRDLAGRVNARLAEEG